MNEKMFAQKKNKPSFPMVYLLAPPLTCHHVWPTDLLSILKNLYPNLNLYNYGCFQIKNNGLKHAPILNVAI